MTSIAPIIKRELDDCTTVCFSSCSVVTALEEMGFDPDSVAMGFFLAKGWTPAQAEALTRAQCNGEFEDIEELAKRVEELK